MDLWIAAFICFWIVCGLGVYGISLAYLWREWPILHDVPSEWRFSRNGAIIMSLCGPGGLIVAFFGSGLMRHGFLFRWSAPRG